MENEERHPPKCICVVCMDARVARNVQAHMHDGPGEECEICKRTQLDIDEDKDSACYALHWKYDDGSGSGILPRLLTAADVDLVSLMREHHCLSGCMEITFVRLELPK